MNSDQIYQAIEAIAGKSGKLDKQALVGDLLQDEDGRRALIVCYDPFVNYGIAKKSMPDVAPGTKVFDDETWKTLDLLASRNLTGNLAKIAVATEIAKLSPASGDLLRRILLKDMRAGFTEGTINRAAPGTIYVFGCQLSQHWSEHKHKLTYPVQIEPKFDGMRVLSFVDTVAGTVRHLSRAGNDVPGAAIATQDLLTVCARNEIFGEIVFDGEILSGNRFESIGNARRSDADSHAGNKLYLFDYIEPGVFKGVPCDKSQLTRRLRLEHVMRVATPDMTIRLSPALSAKNEEQVQAFYEKCLGKPDAEGNCPDAGPAPDAVATTDSAPTDASSTDGAPETCPGTFAPHRRGHFARRCGELSEYARAAVGRGGQGSRSRCKDLDSG